MSVDVSVQGRWVDRWSKANTIRLRAYKWLTLDTSVWKLHASAPQRPGTWVEYKHSVSTEAMAWHQTSDWALPDLMITQIIDVYMHHIGFWFTLTPHFYRFLAWLVDSSHSYNSLIRFVLAGQLVKHHFGELLSYTALVLMDTMSW